MFFGGNGGILNFCGINHGFETMHKIKNPPRQPAICIELQA